ncbi:MAG TPA: pyridoxamine 5'-phosphate oxidase family protein [Ktedonobacterales bacterium]|nr:pyridoxamine 5'-phosphate oxidase family protein [Ktedonobacterales bacterium]
MLDRTDPLQAQTLERLESEEYGFLITVRPDGRPHAIPVCFLYENDSILIFSLPDSVKVRNIRANPHVSLALESFGFEDYFSVVVDGIAELVDEPSNWLRYPPYDAKYRKLSQRIFGADHVPEEYAAQFSQAIRITPVKIRHDN